jgi:hypothetical protein
VTLTALPTVHAANTPFDRENRRLTALRLPKDPYSTGLDLEIVPNTDEYFLRRNELFAGSQQAEWIAEACIHTFLVKQIRCANTEIKLFARKLVIEQQIDNLVGRYGIDQWIIEYSVLIVASVNKLQSRG